LSVPWIIGRLRRDVYPISEAVDAKFGETPSAILRQALLPPSRHSGRSATRTDPESRSYLGTRSSRFRVRAFHARPGM